MTNDNHDLRVSARTARLTAGSNDEDEPPYRFSGVAVAAGDILHMDDGTPVLFTEDELKKAAETQAGEPLTKDHPADEDGRPVYPPPTDETVGKVPKAGWLDSQQAVGYEATAHDESIAQGVQAGSYEVSVHPTFELGAKDEKTGAYKAKNITFRDLSIVSKGDSPSNTAEWGPNQALASYTQGTDIGAELTAADGIDDVDDPEGLVEKLARKFGIIGDSGDSRGAVWFKDQTSDGTSVRVDEARFADAEWQLAAHLEGDDFPNIGPGLGPAIGSSDVYDGGKVAMDATVPFDDPLDEDTTVYVVLHYAGEGGEVLDPITAADGAYFYDSAFVGVAPDGAEVTAEESTGTETTGAESSTDADHDGSSNMDSNTREQYVQFLTANAGFAEESLEAMDDDVLEQTYELAADGAADDADADGGSNDGSDDPDGGGQTLGDMTVDELGDALRDQGFVTQDQAGDLVEEAQAQASKQQKVDEIIAKADDYDKGDREDLLASADALVDREHQRVRGELTAQLPGSAGAGPSLTAGAGSDADADDYGTGVQED
ncbi:DUF7282 domain-containing protein [Halosimplex sp. J119]